MLFPVSLLGTLPLDMVMPAVPDDKVLHERVRPERPAVLKDCFWQQFQPEKE
jgi:hypothetical protein